MLNNSMQKPLGRVDDVHIMVNNNCVHYDFVVLDIECNASCPIILGRSFLRTAGAIIDMKEGNMKYQFPLKKGMEHCLMIALLLIMMLLTFMIVIFLKLSCSCKS